MKQHYLHRHSTSDKETRKRPDSGDATVFRYAGRPGKSGKGFVLCMKLVTFTDKSAICGADSRFNAMENHRTRLLHAVLHLSPVDYNH